MRTALTLLLVCLASTVSAGEPAFRSLMRRVGDYPVGPDTTLRLEKTPDGEVRYTLKRVLNLPDGSIHTLTTNSTFDTGGEDEFLFGWDGLSNMLWMASSNQVMSYRFSEFDQARGVFPLMIVGEADFAKSPKPFQEEVRRRFPDNSLFLMLKTSDSR